MDLIPGFSGIPVFRASSIERQRVKAVFVSVGASYVVA